MAFTEQGSEILEKLVKLTSEDKLEWKKGKSRECVATSGTFEFTIWLAGDRKEFSLRVDEGEKRLIRESVENTIEPEVLAFYDKAAAMEPTASILKALDAIGA